MAHFYGSVRGSSRTEGTRIAGKKAGMYAHIRGWNVGIKAQLHHNAETGKDEVRVYRTGGSNATHSPELVATFIEGEDTQHHDTDRR